ncbi:MAG: hypothetical protein WA784_02555 [Albidovulum sp.]
MKNRLLAAIVGLCLASPAYADTAQMVRDGIAACFQNDTSPRNARKALQEIGWKSQGIEEDLWFFFAPNRKGIAAINSASYDKDGCVFGVKDMSVAQSKILAESIVKEMFGKSAKIAPASELENTDVVMAWYGKSQHTKAGITVSKYMNFPNVYRGSIIAVLFK